MATRNLSWSDFRSGIEPQLHLQPFIRAALPTLQLPSRHDCFEQLQAAIADMRVLAGIGDNLFVASHEIAGRYSVLIYFRDESAQQRSWQLAPSYFMSWSSANGVLPHVHIPDCRFANKRNWYLVSFDSEPSDEQIDLVQTELSACLRWRMTATIPRTKMEQVVSGAGNAITSIVQGS